MELRLSELPVKKKAKIKQYHNDRIASRMLSMGLLPDAEVRIIRYSPFGDALYLKFDGTFAAIRKKEAFQISVTVA
jgi:ferrous iron transport protein A